MKCPQCGYTSFDYVESCEKCGNDLTSARTLLNIPPVKPNTPSFLSALIDGTYTPEQAPEPEETTGESIELSEEEVDLTEKSETLDIETEEAVDLTEKSEGLDSKTEEEEEVDQIEKFEGLDSETEMEFIGQKSEDDK